MLICHCNIFTEKDIEAAILRLLEADPWQLIVPAKVYHSLGRRGRCCSCFPAVVETIIRVTEAFHAGAGEAPAEAQRDDALASHLERVRDLRNRFGSGMPGDREPR